MPEEHQPNFDEEFQEAIANWRARHGLSEDDAVLLLVELFRLHQRHWDQIRFREIPSFEQFRSDLGKLMEAARAFQQQSASLLEALRRRMPQPGARMVTRAAVYAHFANRLFNQPEEQFGGARETIGNYLQYFLTPEVAEVFCAEKSTFDFASIDQGRIICVTMPQNFQTERRYVNTFLKLLYYNHALRRFGQPKADRTKNNRSSSGPMRRSGS